MSWSPQNHPQDLAAPAPVVSPRPARGPATATETFDHVAEAFKHFAGIHMMRTALRLVEEGNCGYIL